jgi:DNA-binding NtrC family response regulator
MSTNLGNLDRSRELILIVDDEFHIRESLTHALHAFGYKTIVASNAAQALDAVRRVNVDILLTDLNMPDVTGLELIRMVKAEDPTVSIVMMTAFGSIETAIEAMKNGAEDYLLKPIELGTLEILIQRILEKRNLRRENVRLSAENRALKENLDVRYHLASMLGVSPQVQELMKSIKLYLKVRTPVLVLGEPGSQLEQIAQILHYNSPWSSTSLIHFDCTMVPSEFHEAQLFGSEERVESGSRIKGTAGLVEKAHFGSMIISDIDHVQKRCQGMLSRVFNQKKCQRSGGTHFYEADVRIVGTAHEKEIAFRVHKNLFRWDLWEFMSDNVIIVPPLRTRTEDLPILILAEAKKHGNFYGKQIQSIHPEVIEQLSRQSFPGNYQELEALVGRATLRCQDSVLRWSDFKMT